MNGYISAFGKCLPSGFCISALSAASCGWDSPPCTRWLREPAQQIPESRKNARAPWSMSADRVKTLRSDSMGCPRTPLVTALLLVALLALVSADLPIHCIHKQVCAASADDSISTLLSESAIFCFLVLNFLHVRLRLPFHSRRRLARGRLTWARTALTAPKRAVTVRRTPTCSTSPSTRMSSRPSRTRRSFSASRMWPRSRARARRARGRWSMTRASRSRLAARLCVNFVGFW
jgi:hypothetical protein